MRMHVHVCPTRSYHLVVLSLSLSSLARSLPAPYGSDKHGVLEYSAQELGHYVNTLTKGNPQPVEFLYVCDEDTISAAWPWDELVAMRDSFLHTQTCFEQYLGYIKVPTAIRTEDLATAADLCRC
jgi:hypothetical protein